jgi:glycosyltransferase involved in cell wall biosynthesis
VRLVTVSYTGLDAGGGVPAFNRTLHRACADASPVHFCWTDFPWHAESPRSSEWDRAALLNRYLVASRRIGSDDIVVADGFWARGLEHVPGAVSVCHGIWSHLTHEDVLGGKQPDMPGHHAAQVAFRRSWMGAGRRTVAVSNFIADQMRLQWGLVVDAVIGNAVDTELFRPMELKSAYRPLVVHGVNDRTNLNKGWDHVEALREAMCSSLDNPSPRPSISLVSLDELVSDLTIPRPLSRSKLPKHEALAQADLLVHPSGFEGHSVLLCEALACGVPVVCYDVGYAQDLRDAGVGVIIDRRARSPQSTVHGVLRCLGMDRATASGRARSLAELELGLDTFTRRWRGYLELGRDG